MGRYAAFFFLVLIAATSIAGTANSTVARTVVTPAERCVRLNRQIDAAMSGDTSNKPVHAARNLQKRGVRLCNSGKRAQGSRSLARALRLLGVKPLDID